MGDFNSHELGMIGDAIFYQIQANRREDISDRSDEGQPWWDVYRKVARLELDAREAEAEKAK